MSTCPYFDKGTRVLIKDTFNVKQRFPELSGTIATVLLVPTHPNTWYTVRCYDSRHVKLQTSAMQYFSSSDDINSGSDGNDRKCFQVGTTIEIVQSSSNEGMKPSYVGKRGKIVDIPVFPDTSYTVRLDGKELRFEISCLRLLSNLVNESEHSEDEVQQVLSKKEDEKCTSNETMFKEDKELKEMQKHKPISEVDEIEEIRKSLDDADDSENEKVWENHALTRGKKVIIRRTNNVEQRVPHLVGKIGIIEDIPQHPNTWLKVSFPDGKVFTFRQSALKLVSECNGDEEEIESVVKKENEIEKEKEVVDEERETEKVDLDEKDEVEEKQEIVEKGTETLLSRIDPDSWVGRRVVVNIGKFEGYHGTVNRSGNGWVQLILDETQEQTAKRAYELTLINDEVPFCESRPALKRRRSQSFDSRSSKVAASLSCQIKDAVDDDTTDTEDNANKRSRRIASRNVSTLMNYSYVGKEVMLPDKRIGVVRKTDRGVCTVEVGCSKVVIKKELLKLCASQEDSKVVATRASDRSNKKNKTEQRKKDPLQAAGNQLSAFREQVKRHLAKQMDHVKNEWLYKIEMGSFRQTEESEDKKKVIDLFMDFYCSCCNYEKESHSNFCWNENCPRSPIFKEKKGNLDKVINLSSHKVYSPFVSRGFEAPIKSSHRSSLFPRVSSSDDAATFRWKMRASYNPCASPKLPQEWEKFTPIQPRRDLKHEQPEVEDPEVRPSPTNSSSSSKKIKSSAYSAPVYQKPRPVTMIPALSMLKIPSNKQSQPTLPSLSLPSYLTPPNLNAELRNHVMASRPFQSQSLTLKDPPPSQLLRHPLVHHIPNINNTEKSERETGKMSSWTTQEP